MPIQATRALLRAALSGELQDAEYRIDELFGFEVPVSVPGVESKLLDPRSTWRDPEAYDAKARELAVMFRDNFAKFDADPAVAAAGPRRLATSEAATLVVTSAFRHAFGVNLEPVVDREEAVATMFAVHDINANIRKIKQLLEGEDGGEEGLPEDDA